MKNVFRLLLISLFCIILSESSYAYKNPNTKGSKVNHKATAAGCAAAAGFTDLNINNVRARINTGGDMWWDLLDVAKYYIPDGSLIDGKGIRPDIEIKIPDSWYEKPMKEQTESLDPQLQKAVDILL